jgi:hypothetical protein
MCNATESAHVLRFRSLRQEGLAFVFPCDESGRVDFDALNDRARNDYLYARAMVGRELAAPWVIAPQLCYRSGGVLSGEWRTFAACSKACA